jgi:formamidopyrimidine-DNA glycosylase
MPEMLEVEAYRRLAEKALGRTIASVDASDAWFLKRGATHAVLSDVLVGRQFDAARRIGKLMLLDVDDAPTLGVRFGMTGRLLVDDAIGVNELQYSSHRLETGWDRFAVHFDDGGHLRVNDPRRLGGIELGPDETRLGPDAASITYRELVAAVDGSEAPLKARLMDQRRVAGLGNLLVDEVLWRAAIDPTRLAVDVDAAERKTLHRSIRTALRVLGRRGGSHTGDMPRDVDVPCPRDGGALQRRTIAGRTTYSCRVHQH